MTRGAERKISVAIATYNRSAILPETVSYILGQTRPPDEIVVVDDGSTDDTATVVRALSEGPVPVRYLPQRNAGPGAALKQAIEACSHEWIAMCDDDDRWLPDHLERRHQLLEAFPDVDYAFSNFDSFGPGAKDDFEEFRNLSPDWWAATMTGTRGDFVRLGGELLRPFLQYNPVFPTSVCMTRALYERMGGIDAKFSRLGCWDAHFTWRSVLHGQVACDRRVTVSTRKHIQNFSRKRSQVNLQRAEMLTGAFHDGWIPNQYDADVRRAVVDSRIRAARWAWMERDFPLVRSALASVPSTHIPAGLRLRARIAQVATAVGWNT